MFQDKRTNERNGGQKRSEEEIDRHVFCVSRKTDILVQTDITQA